MNDTGKRIYEDYGSYFRLIYGKDYFIYHEPERE